MSHAHGTRLLFEISELAARHLVQIHFGATGLRRGIKRCVEGADLLPIISIGVELQQIKFGVARGMLECRHDGIEIGLRRAARHRRDRQIHHVHACLARAKHGTGIDATGIVGVKMNRQTHFAFQRFHQFVRGKGPANSRHILDGNHVGAHLLELLGHAHVILERELVAFLVENIARVTERGFTDRMGLLHRIHGDPQIRQVIERVKNSENVYATRRRMFHKAGHQRVGIIRIAHCVGSTEEHLETNVRHVGPKFTQSFPRILVKKSHGGVKSSATPHFQRIQLGGPAGQMPGAGDHVVTAHPRRHERLMGVTKSRVGNQEALLFQRPLGELFGPELQQQLAGAGHRCTPVIPARRTHGGQYLAGPIAFGVRVAIDDDVA